ncbi:unnamed protein product [Spirodela intermedia]|uniref:Uncharacterized protein n=1 Tax=Spirodela intermedia TaxID=51605 RepID=A0A7I8K9Y5_SPIIN|nr:unnamed protein product [Spirodela intermedia]
MREPLCSLPVFWLLWSAAVLQCGLPRGVHATKLVRALYVFGDSLVDVGNNNHLRFSVLKANYRHNGIDYPGGESTGRFSNGKNAADFIAMHVGLESPPPYLSLRSTSNRTAVFLSGVNFASGGCGISDETAKKLEQCLPLKKQIRYYSHLRQSLVQQLGNMNAGKHLERSLFLLVIGNNDIFHYVKAVSEGYLWIPPPLEFIDSLVLMLEGQLKRLYELGARRLIFVGTGPLGCCPSHRIGNKGWKCDPYTNWLSLSYNTAVRQMLQKMISGFHDWRYSFFDTYKAVMEYIDMPERYGFVEAKTACCGLGPLRAKVPCLPISYYCSNRDEHVFWDFRHPTEAAYRNLCDMILRGSEEYVYPINGSQLVSI